MQPHISTKRTRRQPAGRIDRIFVMWGCRDIKCWEKPEGSCRCHRSGQTRVFVDTDSVDRFVQEHEAGLVAGIYLEFPLFTIRYILKGFHGTGEVPVGVPEECCRAAQPFPAGAECGEKFR